MLCYAQSPRFYLFIYLLLLFGCVVGFRHFMKKNAKKNFLSQIPFFFFLEKFRQKNDFFLISKIRHYCVQYDMKGCLRFYNSIF
jgi:hypothetical protein